MDRLKIKSYSDSEFIFIPEGNAARFTLFFVSKLTEKRDEKFLLSKSEFISNYHLISSFLSQADFDLEIDDEIYDFIEAQPDYKEIVTDPLDWNIVEKKLKDDTFKSVINYQEIN